MPFEYAAPYLPLFTTKARYIHLWGGRGRGGSFTATQYALQLITSKNYFRGYFMREIFNDIRDSLWRDFKDRIDENPDINEADFAFNDSQMVVTYIPTGNTIISKGFKKSSGNRTAKLKSLAGATHVFVEESEENEMEAFRQLDDSLRTTKSDTQIVMVFNPPKKNHWIIKRWYNLVDSKHTGYYLAIPKADDKLLSIHSTYLDNLANLNESFITNLINYQSSDPDYYYTMVEGLVTEGAKGRIYRNWIHIDQMPQLPVFYGLDFGFNDPVSLVEVSAHNQNIWAREMVYEQNVTNSDLSVKMTALGVKKTAPIYADSAEPKSIAELKRLGWNIIPAEKGPDSVRSGIKFLKQYNVHVTDGSKNFWTENEDYKWMLDAEKNPTDEPEDKNNHLMDALRYAVTGKLKGGLKLRAI